VFGGGDICFEQRLENTIGIVAVTHHEDAYTCLRKENGVKFVKQDASLV
jgi:ApbE superfamily uncharacterized protein (UPF0280 family)